MKLNEDKRAAVIELIAFYSQAKKVKKCRSRGVIFTAYPTVIAEKSG